MRDHVGSFFHAIKDHKKFPIIQEGTNVFKMHPSRK